MKRMNFPSHCAFTSFLRSIRAADDLAYITGASKKGSAVENLLTCRDAVSTPCQEDTLEERHGNPLQYSQGALMDRRRLGGHGPRATKGQGRLKGVSMHVYV